MSLADFLGVVVRAVLIGFLLSVLLIRLFEERFIFFPELAAGGGKPEDVGLRVEDVFLTTADGVRLHAWWLSEPAARHRGSRPGSSTLSRPPPGAG